jgi:hypothetical protein
MDRNLFLALTLSATFQCLAQTPEPIEVRRAEVVFEELPELKASEILKPELLKGPHYTVRDPVPTASGMNQFTIDSDFGVFEADGNEILLQRLKEIDAIARLQDVSRTDEFKKSLVAAAKSRSTRPRLSGEVPHLCARNWKSADDGTRSARSRSAQMITTRTQRP